jgi:hypothetical protein
MDCKQICQVGWENQCEYCGTMQKLLHLRITPHLFTVCIFFTHIIKFNVPQNCKNYHVTTEPTTDHWPRCYIRHYTASCLTIRHTNGKHSSIKAITSNGVCRFAFIYTDAMWHPCIWLLFYGKLIPVTGSIMTRKYIKTSKILTCFLNVNFPVATSLSCVVILSWPSPFHSIQLYSDCTSTTIAFIFISLTTALCPLRSIVWVYILFLRSLVLFITKYFTCVSCLSIYYIKSLLIYFY